ncbi:hypothetical protein TIFTF001_046977 [Ficus carica]|uniref:Uncharacterized protein n=1 Tax=Ficus carica TaxID=3494 RepID=A0AA87YPF5_FICCA|nr:hypothetical protein TIFTF001_046977 [Ficus carica]
MIACHGKQTYRQCLMQDCGKMALQTVKCGMDTATGFGKYVVSCYMLCYVIMKYVMGKEKFQGLRAREIRAPDVGDHGEAGDVGVGLPSCDLATSDNWWLDNQPDDFGDLGSRARSPSPPVPPTSSRVFSCPANQSLLPPPKHFPVRSLSGEPPWLLVFWMKEKEDYPFWLSVMICKGTTLFLMYPSIYTVKTDPMENEHCGKKQGKNEIVGDVVWLSHAEEVLQQLDFSNLVSPNDVCFDPARIPSVGVNSSPSPTECWPSID